MNTEDYIAQEIEALEEAITSGAIELTASNCGRQVWDIVGKLSRADRGYFIDSYLRDGKVQGGFVELYEDSILIPYGEIEIPLEEWESMDPESQSDWVVNGESAYLELQAIQWFFTAEDLETIRIDALENYPSAFGWGECYVYDFPAYALSALVNGDHTGMNEKDDESLKDFLERESYVHTWEPVGESYFCNFPAFGLACDCVKVLGFTEKETA